jgi:hypothetical protein
MVNCPEILTTKLYTMALNSWYTNNKNEVFPAEVAITEFSLQVKLHLHGRRM